MTGLDTNVIVRALTLDDPAQAKQATKVLRSAVWVSKTVLVEVEWVLRKAYGFSSQRVHHGLTRLLGLERLTVEDRPAVVKALEWHAKGLDFADAVHLASCRGASVFATFDAALAKGAARVDATPAVRFL